MVWSGDDQFKEIRCDSGTAFLLYEMLYADDILSQLTNALYRTETHVDNGALFFVAIYAYERGTMGVFLAVQTINLEKEKEKET